MSGDESWFILCGLSISAVVGYLLGDRKGKPIRGAILGFLLGPLGWLLVLISPDDSPTCPYCKGKVVAGASRCKNCGSRIPRCPACNARVGTVRLRRCKKCGETLPADVWPDDDQGSARNSRLKSPNS